MTLPMLEEMTTPEPNTGCWLWTGTIGHYGYGVGGSGYRTPRFRAHRLAWELANGRPVPLGMDVCHRCDNPPCVNPDHLFVGTRLDNMQDARRKGRLAIGSRHGQAKLSEDDVLSAVRMLRAGVRQSVVARSIGVSASTISLLSSGKRWGHLTGIGVPE